MIDFVRDYFLLFFWGVFVFLGCLLKKSGLLGVLALFSCVVCGNYCLITFCIVVFSAFVSLR